jgi:hypothetical protein
MLSCGWNHEEQWVSGVTKTANVKLATESTTYTVTSDYVSLMIVLPQAPTHSLMGAYDILQTGDPDRGPHLFSIVCSMRKNDKRVDVHALSEYKLVLSVPFHRGFVILCPCANLANHLCFVMLPTRSTGGILSIKAPQSRRGPRGQGLKFWRRNIACRLEILFKLDLLAKAAAPFVSVGTYVPMTKHLRTYDQGLLNARVKSNVQRTTKDAPLTMIPLPAPLMLDCFDGPALFVVDMRSQPPAVCVASLILPPAAFRL